MQWIIPGTVITGDTRDAALVEGQLRAMFLAGNIALSQVTGLTGLEPHTVQNWVKRGFLSKPERKRYSLTQLCRIININMLRSALTLEQVCTLLGYVNGALDDESDDLIDDAELTFQFLRLAALFTERGNSNLDSSVEQVLKDYQAPTPDAKERVAKVLQIMVTAWAASTLQQKAAAMARQLQ